MGNSSGENYAISTSTEKWCACCEWDMIYECFNFSSLQGFAFSWQWLFFCCTLLFWSQSPENSGSARLSVRLWWPTSLYMVSSRSSASEEADDELLLSLTSLNCWINAHADWIVSIKVHLFSLQGYFSNVVSDVMNRSLLWLSPQWLIGGWDPGSAGASLLPSPETGSCQWLRV